MAEKTKQDDQNPQAGKTDLEIFFLYSLPTFFKKHLDRILIGVLLVAAATMFWRFRSQSLESEASSIDQSSALVWESIISQRMPLSVPAFDADGLKGQLDAYTGIERLIKNVLDGSQSTDLQKASALLARGELNWMMANLAAKSAASPAVSPGTTTAPTTAAVLKLEPADVYLAQSEQAYREILGPYEKQTELAFRALFGLAGVMENRGKFDEAKQAYERVIAHAQSSPFYKDLARSRIQLLADLGTNFRPITATSRPVPRPDPAAAAFMPPATPIPAGPTTLPAVAAPTTQPSN
jgi:tetratricopeptide (TPR) repeat protein